MAFEMSKPQTEGIPKAFCECQVVDVPVNQLWDLYSLPRVRVSLRCCLAVIVVLQTVCREVEKKKKDL